MLKKPTLIGQKYHKKLHVHMCACACECGNMTKFIRQKGGAECEHSEDVCEADQRHKLTLSTWSDIVILNVRLYTMVGPITNFFSNHFGAPWIFIIKVR